MTLYLTFTHPSCGRPFTRAKGRRENEEIKYCSLFLYFLLHIIPPFFNPFSFRPLLGALSLRAGIDGRYNNTLQNTTMIKLQ